MTYFDACEKGIILIDHYVNKSCTVSTNEATKVNLLPLGNDGATVMGWNLLLKN